MADFFESEAEVSEDEEGVKASSDEEEEDDDNQENVADLINDDVEEEEGDGDDDDYDSDDEVRGRGSKRRHEELDDRLEDDDFDLIEENLGVRVERKKFRRVRRIVEDDESDDEDEAGPSADVEDDRDAIAADLFKPGDDDEEEAMDDEEGDHHLRHRHQDEAQEDEDQFAEIESGEESDPNDFIVDDEGQPIARKKKKGHKPRYNDAALQEAQDIFGLDFEFEEFDQYAGDEYEDEEVTEEEYDEYEDEEADIEQVQERRKGKKSRKGKSKKSIYEVFEPSELERGHFTDFDNEIRTADVPERFMLRRVPVTEAENTELEVEADWIYHQAFLTPSISNQEFSDQGDGGYGASLYERKPPRTKNKIREALHFMRNQHFEVPFIAFYRKEYVEPELNFNDLYKVYHWDEKWCQLKTRKENLRKLFEKMQAYQFDQINTDSDEPLPESLRTLTEADIDKLEEVDTMEKLKDVYLHFLLYYGRDIPKMHNSAKQKPKKTKIVVNKKKVKKTITKTVLVKRKKQKKEDEDNKEKEVEDGEEKEGEDGEEKKDEEKEGEEKSEIDKEEKDGDEDNKEKEGSEDGEKEEGENSEEKKDEEKDSEEKEEGEVAEKENEEGEIVDEDKDKDKEDSEDKEKTDEDKEEGEMEDSEEEVEEEVETEVETEEEEEIEVTDYEDNEGTSHEIKQATRKSLYAICQEAGLDGFAKKFGLTPEQFAENLRDNYGRHDPEQWPEEPLNAAKEYISRKFQTPEAVLRAARYMVALQLAHEPLVRQCVRQTFYERAKICVRPTKKGIKEIDEAHPCFGSKYLKNKQVKDLLGDQFLRLLQAESDKLITMSISIDMEKEDGSSFSSTSYFEEIKQLYYRDEFSSNVQEWNKERSAAIEIALTNVLYKEFTKEIRVKLEQETKDGIIKLCCRKLFEWLKVMPYQADQQMDEDDDDDYLDGSGPLGLRVMGVAVPSDLETSTFCALLDGDGEVSDFLRLPHFLRKRNAHFQRDRELKEIDVEALKNFLSNKKPHVIAVAAESRTTLSVIEDIKRCTQALESEQQMAPINVQLMDSNCAVIYQNSKQAETEYREYPPLLRQAISIARRLQEPLVELSRMCNADDDLLCVQFHPLQDQVNKDDLRDALYQEFIYRVNEVGVDLNQAIAHPHKSSLVQFVCGLGPRKGNAMIRTLKQQNQRLENRNHLVTVCELGPKVFINCAGFTKIDTASVSDATDSYIEVLDSTRIHPETYEWARKMAVDALEYDESAEDANPAEALEEILENPDKLKDLDLDAFAEELERQGYGNKSITLYDIRAELNSRYKDLRTPYHPPTAEEVFSMLTKETPETFYKGKMCLAQVTSIARRRPPKDELDNANPVRNDETGLWRCPFCSQDDFPELSEVWSHFDAGNCPGQAVGVQVRLENGIQGFIATRNISDKKVVNPEDRVQFGMTFHCRIIKIDIERFKVELTCKSSDLQDKNGEWAPPKDTYYDHDSAEKDQKKSDAEKKAHQSTYVKRVIVHPSFKNVTFKQAEKMIAEMEQGEVIIRPSSKGSDHLTVTWKVDEGIFSHIDVREEGKENVFSLGKSLVIGKEEFEDLDEIVARYVQPMAAYVRDVMTHKYYRNSERGKREILDKLLATEKKKAPSRIPYFMSFTKEYPGKFLLSYQPRTKPRHEYVTVTPEGYRYRQQMHSSINSLLRWFKEHFRDPIPGMTPQTNAYKTPMGAAPEGTPAPYYAGTPMIHKTGPGGIPMFTPSIIATPRQTPGATPQVGAAGRYGSLVGTSSYPYATPQTNPMATPMAHATPQYQPMSMSTPSQNPMRTPQYQPTPRATWGGATPQTTQVVRAIQRHVQGGSGQQQQQQSQPSGRAAVDWAQQAANWARQRQQTNPGRSPATHGGSTPRHGGSTPRHGGSTPRHGSSTPRHHSGSTPRHHSGSTPRHHSGSTPRHHSGMTPRHHGGMTPRSGSMTPRGSGTPRSSGGYHDPSPMSISTPGGDATPLFDET